MAQQATFQLVGYTELLRNIAVLDRDTKKAVRTTLRHVGDAVKTDATARVRGQHPKDTKTAAGYRTVVRQRGIAVEQSLRKTTGLHPEWGSWQMRHGLIPALIANEPETQRELEHSIGEVCDRFNRAA